MWRQRYPTLDSAHHAELESRAAVKELSDGVPPHEAEAQAHAEYLREHMIGAAAHHLAGVRAAHVVGDMENAARHSLRYGVMARALKFDPHGEPIPEVAARARDPELTRVYAFKGHDADALLLNHLLGQRMAKAEGDEAAPLGGAEVTGDVPTPGRRTFDLTHVLPRMRREQGERLTVIEGPQGRTAHHVRDEAGRRVPLHALAEAEGGAEAIGGQPAPEDVRQAADLAFRLRRAASLASIVERVRHTAAALARTRG